MENHRNLAVFSSLVSAIIIAMLCVFINGHSLFYYFIISSIGVIFAYLIFKTKKERIALPTKKYNMSLGADLTVPGAYRLAEIALKVFAPSNASRLNFVQDGLLSGDFAILYLSGETEKLFEIVDEPAYRVSVHLLERDEIYFIRKKNLGFLWPLPPHHFGAASFLPLGSFLPEVVDGWKFDEDLEALKEMWVNALRDTEVESLF